MKERQKEHCNETYFWTVFWYKLWKILTQTIQLINDWPQNNPHIKNHMSHYLVFQWQSFLININSSAVAQRFNVIDSKSAQGAIHGPECIQNPAWHLSWKSILDVWLGSEYVSVGVTQNSQPRNLENLPKTYSWWISQHINLSYN